MAKTKAKKSQGRNAKRQSPSIRKSPRAKTPKISKFASPKTPVKTAAKGRQTRSTTAKAKSKGKGKKVSKTLSFDNMEESSEDEHDEGDEHDDPDEGDEDDEEERSTDTDRARMTEAITLLANIQKEQSTMQSKAAADAVGRSVKGTIKSSSTLLQACNVLHKIEQNCDKTAEMFALYSKKVNVNSLKNVADSIKTAAIGSKEELDNAHWGQLVESTLQHLSQGSRSVTQTLKDELAPNKYKALKAETLKAFVNRFVDDAETAISVTDSCTTISFNHDDTIAVVDDMLQALPATITSTIDTYASKLRGDNSVDLEALRLCFKQMRTNVLNEAEALWNRHNEPQMQDQYRGQGQGGRGRRQYNGPLPMAVATPAADPLDTPTATPGLPPGGATPPNATGQGSNMQPTMPVSAVSPGGFGMLTPGPGPPSTPPPMTTPPLSMAGGNRFGGQQPHGGAPRLRTKSRPTDPCRRHICKGAPTHQIAWCPHFTGCNGCGEKGHYQANCPKKQPRKSDFR